MLGQAETIREYQQRFPLLFYGIIFFFTLVSSRLFYLQVLKGTLYRQFSDKNSLRREKIVAPRGQVLDRNRKILVDNRLQLDITLTPQFIKNPKPILEQLAAVSGQTYDKLKQTYQAEFEKSPKFQPITILKNADWPVIVQVESMKVQYPGIEVAQRIRRTYLHKQVGAHLFGYLGEASKKDIDKKSARPKLCSEYDLPYTNGDIMGQSGLEKQWETCLRGIDGSRYVMVNAHGHSVEISDKESFDFGSFQRFVSPKPGHRLVLTIDEDLQLAAAKAMEGKMGAVVALDPRTGEVLAMVSQPSFDPTEMNGKPQELWQSVLNNPYGPLRNKAIQDFYSPGSTFKIVTALSALENGVLKPETIINCPATLHFGNRPFHEHIKQGFGRITIHEAIMKSSDVFFWQVSLMLGIDAIAKVAFDLGLGKLTGVDLADETSGLIPTEEWKRRKMGQPWHAGETLSAAIGQGYVAVTPIQLANAFATMVNGGNLYKPYVVSQIEDNDGHIIAKFGPQLKYKRPIPEDIDQVLRKAMHAVVNSVGGTAHSTAYTKDEIISGKTGTVQVVSMTKEQLFSSCNDMPFERRHHAWFAGFAPKDNPEIAIAVFTQHGCGGSRSAAPVAKAVIERWWEKKKTQNSHQPASTL